MFKIRGFLLKDGDIVLAKDGGNTISPNGKRIQLIEGNELIAQKFLVVLGTNIGEWFWNENLGVNYDYLIGKGITEDMIRSQIEVGIHQIDENMYLSDFKVDFDKKNRTADISFTVEDDGGKIVKIEKIYGKESGEGSLAKAQTRIVAYENALRKLEKRLKG